MESLARFINLNLIPAGWDKYAYFSKKSLLDWFIDMKERVTQLVGW
jgi:dynein heavy chain